MGKYAYTGLWVEYALGKSYYVSKIPPVQTKNQIITVSVFLRTLQSTDLLSKRFHLLLHGYTVAYARHDLSMCIIRGHMPHGLVMSRDMSILRDMTCLETCVSFET